MQNVIRDCLLNCYSLLKKLRITDVEWLLGPIGRKPMCIMGAYYRGGALGVHLDSGTFISVAIVLVMRNRHRWKGCAGIKIISFGMEKYQSINKGAEIETPEYCVYIFWDWLVEWGCHGVPHSADNDSVVVIIRKGKFTIQ